MTQPTDVPEVPQAPSADRVSTVAPKRAPNWALKTAMAVTGALAAVVLLVLLVLNASALAVVGLLQYLTSRPLAATASWSVFWGVPSPVVVSALVLLLALVLLVAHAVIGVALLVRARSARGRVAASLHGGLGSWWTRSMPVTGSVIALGVVAWLIWPTYWQTWMAIPDCPPDVYCPTMVGIQVVSPLPLAVAYAIYVVFLVAAGLHVAHGLATVATIAAGNGVVLGRVRRVVVIVGGVLLALLVVANIVAPAAVWRPM